MRFMLAACAVILAAVVAGCGGGNAVTPPVPVVVVGSYLGDAFMTINGTTELVANLGLVVRADRTVEGAGFFSAPVVEHDFFFTGVVDASNNLTASGTMVSGDGTQDAGSFTLTGAFGNFPDGSNVKGEFTAQGIGSGTWRGFSYAIYPLGCYMGTYSGDRQGTIAVMNFRVDDAVVMLKEEGQAQTDYFAAPNLLIPPVQSGGDYSLLADDSWYGTGMVVAGDVSATTAGGDWQQTQAPSSLVGTWSASKPESRAAGRGLPAGPLRVYRAR
ncbi:MAG TPA: hypothetical protein VM221_11400 [Armatimonadota bacterium]|nr:hypothetical protein [Armatimonadota bacterium]